MKSRAHYMFVAMLAAPALGFACSSPDTTGRVDPAGPAGPNFADFKAVAPMLMRRCGSIDCHGSTYRNFRLYGYGGTRFDAGRPDDPPSLSEDEVKADYDAVVGLEPELMRDVVNAGGAGYERLTLVRKGRNDEAHKGGQRIKHIDPPGEPDPAELCLLSWLSNTTNIAACNSAACVAADGGRIPACAE